MKIFTPKVFSPLFEDIHEPKNFVALSGRNSGKTEAFARALFYYVTSHNMSALVVSKNKKYIPRTILRTLKRVAMEIGVYSEFDWPKSKPYQITSKKYNFSIDFFGIGDDVYNIKGYEPNSKLISVWFEEFGEMDYDDIQIIKQTVTRNMLDNRKFMYSGNPPKRYNAWNRLWVEQMRKDSNYHIFDVNCFSIYPFLSDSNKLDIIELYKSNPKDFDYTYLGKPYTEGTLVYSEIEDNKIISKDTILDGDPVAWSLGIDVAVVKDKTAVVLSLLLNSGRIITRKVWTHDPLINGRATIGEQAEFIYEKIFKVIMNSPIVLGGKRYNLKNYDYVVVLDSSNYSLIDELRKRGVKARNTKNKKQLKDIELMRTLIRNNRLYFVNAVENQRPCYQLMEELSLLSWYIPDNNDENSIDIISNMKKQESFTLVGKKDAENAWRYGVKPLARWLGRNNGLIEPLSECEPVMSISKIGEING
jgi:PBSX family phage terminase large subunit